jgi:hypothetical protein
MGETTPERVAWGLTVLALVGGLVAFFYCPFLFGPAGVVLLAIAIIITSRHRTLTAVAMLVVGLGTVVGGSIAAATGNPLY